MKRYMYTALAIIGGALATAAFAQQANETLPGFRSPGAYDATSIDNIDIFSGDIGLVVPLSPQYPLGPGFSWGLSAFGTDKIWNFVVDPNSGCDLALVHGKPTLGAGWTLDLGHIEKATTNGGTYVSPDGGQHTGTNLNPTTDASRLRVKCTSTTSCTVESPDGIVQNFTHSYDIPRASPGTSWDFNSVPPTDPVPKEVGLTSITNHYNKTLLSVTYSSTEPWKVTQITLEPGTSQQRVVTYTWSTLNVLNTATWPVLSQIQFPTAAGVSHPLTVSFAYDTTNGAPIERNTYDTGITCNPQSVAYVPTVLSMTFKDGASVLKTYSFTYIHNSGGDTDGVITHVVLPTGGTIDYTYRAGATAHHSTGEPTDLEASAVDPPNFGAGPVAPEGPLSRTCVSQWIVNLDHSAAVIKRVAKASTTDTGITTQYARDEYEAFDPCNQTGDSKITRRVIVSDPNGDGTVRYSKYLFHVPDVDGEDPTLAGIELTRRSYADTNFGGTPFRTTVNCYEADSGGGAICGYRATSGAVQSYTLGGHVRRQAEVEWFGANPTGGGDCSQSATTACSQRVNSAYNATALMYGTNVLSSTLTLATTRTTTTTWAPYVTTGTPGNWFLNLYSQRVTSDPTMTVDEHAEFGTTTSPGFLKGHNIFDSPSGRLVLQCYYPDSGGNLSQEFSASFTNILPGQEVNTCTLNYPTIPTNGAIGLNNDAFGHNYDWQSGVPLTDRWLLDTGTGSVNPLSWYAYRVVREPAEGAITDSYDQMSNDTTYAYDALGRIKTITPPGVAATNVSYDSAVQTTVSRTGTDDSIWQRFIVDGLGRLLREIKQMPANYAVRTHHFDLAGHQDTVSIWATCTSVSGDCTTLLPAAEVTSSNFDPLGRAQTVKKADGSTTNIDFTDNSVTPNILFSDSKVTSTTLNVNGTCSGGVCTGGFSSSPTWRKDNLGRLVRYLDPAGTLTTYTYDVNDKLSSVIQGQQTRTFTYDPFGFLRAQTTPEGGTVNYTIYNSVGGLLHKDDPGGFTLDPTYEAAARVATEKTNGATALTNTYSTTNGLLLTQTGYNRALTGAPSVADTFTYAGTGSRLSQRKRVITGGPVTPVTSYETWTYDALGLVKTYGHPIATGTTPTTVESTTHSFGLPTALSIVSGPTLVSAATYAPTGALKTWTAGSGMVTTITQDPTGLARPASFSSGAPNNFATGSYVYDGGGNIVAIGTNTYAYDTLSRITSGTVNSQNKTFAYDIYGNLNPSGVNPANNQLTAGTYGARGNLTSLLVNGVTSTYQYDNLGRQWSFSNPTTSETYAYDGRDERIARIASTGATWFLTYRDGGNHLTTEYSIATGGMPVKTKDYFWLGNTLVATQTAAGAVSYFSTDHLGTIRIDSAAPSTHHDYFPYGEEVTASGSNLPLRFAAMERDVTTSGNDYDHARVHLPGLGRFVAIDKVGGIEFDPQSWNRYTYANDNPLLYVDQNGRDALAVVGAGAISPFTAGALSLAGGVYAGLEIGSLSIGGQTINEYATQTWESILGQPQILEMGRRQNETGLEGLDDDALRAIEQNKSLSVEKRRQAQRQRKFNQKRNTRKDRGGPNKGGGPKLIVPGVSQGRGDSSGDSSSLFGPGYMSFQLFLLDFNNSVPPGGTSTSSSTGNLGCGDPAFVGPCQPMQSTYSGGPPTY